LKNASWFAVSPGSGPPASGPPPRTPGVAREEINRGGDLRMEEEETDYGRDN
jgi:hypothetical protein